MVLHSLPTLENPNPENGDENAPAPRRRRQPLRDLGIVFPEWEDERTAPPVDEALIGSLLDRRLDRDETRRVIDLILHFRSWAQAYARLGSERDRRDAADGG